MGAQNAKADLEEYRQGYPRLQDDPHQKDNLRFYKGKIKSVPSGDFIDTIHEKWWGNYALLERHHGYIQWLFPIREHGMNMQSQVLQLHEAEGIKADPECMKRVLRSYELMLEFYGMKLKNPETGELERSDNYKSRYRNLNSSSHNYLRITRILKSLGELGYEHLKFNFLAFVAQEVWEHRELSNTKSSLEHYWSGTLRDDTQRARIEQIIKDHKTAAGEDNEDRYTAYRRGPSVAGYQQRYAGVDRASANAGGRRGGISAEDEHLADKVHDADDSDEHGHRGKRRQANANPKPDPEAEAEAEEDGGEAEAHHEADTKGKTKLSKSDSDEAMQLRKKHSYQSANANPTPAIENEAGEVEDDEEEATEHTSTGGGAESQGE